MSCCSHLILHYPYIPLILLLLLSSGCLVVILFIGPLPDFSEPTLGFETRGTEISRRLRAYSRLLDSTDTYPPEVRPTAATPGITALPDDISDDTDEWNSTDFQDTGDPSFFCDSPNVYYVKLVFESCDGKSLWSASNLHSMCRVETSHVRANDKFELSCDRPSTHHECCRSWSLGNYVALLANKSSCFHIDDDDVALVHHLLFECVAVFRANLHVPESCWNQETDASDLCEMEIPFPCRQRHAALYHIMFHLVDSDFLLNLTTLKYAISFLPLDGGIDARDLYFSLESLEHLTDGKTRISAYDFGLKHDVFEKVLLADMLWFGLAFVSVAVVVWLYTTSVFITVATFTAIFFSLVVAFCVYTHVLRIHLFPFTNLLAIVILVGMGVDDVFVYLKIWQYSKLAPNSPTPKRLVANAAKRSTPSALATSATTAAALFAGAVSSNVVVLRCFGIFAGIAVVLHFVMLAVAMPGIIVCYERWFHFRWSQLLPVKLLTCLEVTRTRLQRVTVHSLPYLVDKLRFVILLLLLLLGVLSVLAVFLYPKLQLPSSREFQLLVSEHPFEVYDLRLKQKFMFYRGVDMSGLPLPMTVVWGIDKEDTSAWTNVKDKGSIQYNADFDIASVEARQFLLKFCRRLRASPYYAQETGLQLTNCFIENFERFMKRSCVNMVDGSSLEPCCGANRLAKPYSADTFRLCLHEYLPRMLHSARRYHANPIAGPRFSRQTGQLSAVVVEFTSTETFSLNYSRMNEFFTSVDRHVRDSMADAPPGMRDGFFASYLEYYDLQNTLASGIPLSVGLSMSAAAVVCLLTTLNLVVTLYAMLTVLLAVCVTVAGLVCLGWQLNIVESVTISVAVGMSVDFSLHHAVAYCLSGLQFDRRRRVLSAAEHVSVPVAMAAVTTFLAGAMLMPSSVLAYRQIGIFLMLVTAVSWAYATLFLQAALFVAGPQDGDGQVRVCCCPRRAGTAEGSGHKAKTVYLTGECSAASASTSATVNGEPEVVDRLTTAP